MAREWGVQPSEFWAMSPAEWWAEFDTKQAAHKRMNDPASSFGADKWAEARRRHKERRQASLSAPAA